MEKNRAFLALLLIFISTPIFSIILPCTPSGRLGKNYEIYGMMAPLAYSISNEPGFENGPREMGFGLRSNIGMDLFDFGLLLEMATSGEERNGILGISGDVKYGLMQSDSLLLSADAGISRAWPDTWVFRFGPALNIPVLSGMFDVVVSAFYQNNLKDCYSLFSTYDIHTYFPSGSSLYYYIGAEIPGALADSSLGAGFSYLQIIGRTDADAQAYGQFYFQFTGKFGFNPKKTDVVPPAGAFKPSGIATAESFAANARVFMGSGLYAQAVTELQNGLNEYPDDYLLNNLMGNCYYKLGEKMKAYIYYKKALLANPDDMSAGEFVKKLGKELKDAK